MNPFLQLLCIFLLSLLLFDYMQKPVVDQVYSSDVSLAVCNKSDVSVGFIRKSRTNFIDLQVSAIYQ